MDITLIGTDHHTQWRDQTRHFHILLTEQLAKGKPDLIVEEALRLPTTVGFRIAMKNDIPWADVDMDHYQRKDAEIDEDVPTWPEWNESGQMGVGNRYIPRVQGIRENYWYQQIQKHSCQKVWLICGSIHLIPLARKLRADNHDVTEVKVWEFDWYKKVVGSFDITENSEGWTSKFFGI